MLDMILSFIPQLGIQKLITMVYNALKALVFNII